MLHIPLGQIEDNEILEVVSDLAQILRWPLLDFEEHTVFDFLQIVMTEKLLSTTYLPSPSILDKKMAKIQDHGFYQVCKQLVGNLSLEPYDRKTLLSFLKSHFTCSRSKAIYLPSNPTDQERKIDLIRLRRRNGTL